jgi:mersacidin/lichenicidin family type 2 lantibiotic
MKFDIVRAWKDEAYRESLSQEQKALLPANPAGELEMSDAELATVIGAGNSGYGDNCDRNPCYHGAHRSNQRFYRRRHSGSSCGYGYRRSCGYDGGIFLHGSFGLGCDC